MLEWCINHFKDCVNVEDASGLTAFGHVALAQQADYSESGTACLQAQLTRTMPHACIPPAICSSCLQLLMRYNVSLFQSQILYHSGALLSISSANPGWVKAQVNERNQRGQSALMLSAMAGQVENVKLLLQHGDQSKRPNSP